MVADRGNFTIIPNIIEEDDRIDAAAFRVYCHYRRKAGEAGIYTGGVRATADACKLSQPTTIKAKALLVATGYISVTRCQRDDMRWADEIRITDMWAANAEHFQKVGALNNESAQEEPEPDHRSITEAHALNNESAQEGARSKVEAHALKNESVTAKIPGTVNKKRKNQEEDGASPPPVVPSELPTEETRQPPATKRRKQPSRAEPVPENLTKAEKRARGQVVLSDTEFVDGLRPVFPTLNLEYQGGKWLDYLETAEPKRNYKNAFRNWLEIAVDIAAKQARRNGTNGTGPPGSRASPTADLPESIRAYRGIGSEMG